MHRDGNLLGRRGRLSRAGEGNRKCAEAKHDRQDENAAHDVPQMDLFGHSRLTKTGKGARLGQSIAIWTKYSLNQRRTPWRWLGESYRAFTVAPIQRRAGAASSIYLVAVSLCAGFTRRGYLPNSVAASRIRRSHAGAPPVTGSARACWRQVLQRQCLAASAVASADAMAGHAARA